MLRAGQAAATLACELAKHNTLTIQPVCILAGPGNNGGDGFVVARILLELEHSVQVFELASRSEPSADAAKARQDFIQAGGVVNSIELWRGFRVNEMIIDALFGIGFKSNNISNPQLIKVIAAANAYARQHGTPLLALDLPSGLNADTGVALHNCIHATHTISFIAAKPGLFTLDAVDVCGSITIADLGLSSLVEQFAHHSLGVVCIKTDQQHALTLPKRRLNSHKGSFGDVIVIGGSDGMTGAAILASRAALLAGAGRVYAALLSPQHSQSAHAFDPHYPEIMFRDVNTLLHQSGVFVIGPGMGQSPQMQALMTSLLAIQACVVIDADALNLMATHPALQLQCKQRLWPTIITPHPLEAARLLACDLTQVQADRFSAAATLATQLNAVVVLKGAGCIIATNQYLSVNLSGSPALATGGSGDVLAGLIGAVQACLQKHHASENAQTNKLNTDKLNQLATNAAEFSVWLHGKAGQALPSLETSSPHTLTASQIALRVQTLLNMNLALAS